MRTLSTLLLFGAGLLSGCHGLDVRSQSPEDEQPAGSDVQLVGDLAVPFGMHRIQVEGIGLVTGLEGTGSDPSPSAYRAGLLDEMRRHDVKSDVLASDSTALVLVRAYLRPGIQKGDLIDVEVRIPSQSETTSLRNGWLLETRLREMALLENRLRDGVPMAISQGPILIDPTAESRGDRVMATRGRILGGAVVLDSRTLGLVLGETAKSIRRSSQIGAAINRRFHTFSGGTKDGVATPKTDEFVQLIVHPRYKDNIARYMQVVRSVPLHESPVKRLARLGNLEQQLLDPIMASGASVRLEAIGSDDAADKLIRGIHSSNAEVRFHAAEALAYLDRSEAAAPLAIAARDEPAFRVFALTALSAMDDPAAYDALRGLLSQTSAETRYGAFRGLWAMNPRDPLIRGEQLGDQFSYHLLNTDGPPMIHLTRSRRPEVVVFGQDQRLSGPLMLDAGNTILVTSRTRDEVTVSRIKLGEPDQKRVVSTRVDDVIRAIVELGGTYPDVLQMLEQAQQIGALASRLEIDALPQAGRRFRRDVVAAESGIRLDFAKPLPELFATRRSTDRATPKPASADIEKAEEERRSLRAFFGKMTSGRSD